MGSEGAKRWAHACGYVALAAVLTFVHLLPFGFPGGFPGPDLLLCATFAWALRSPRYLPISLVAAVFLATDLLFQRPPGLWAALAVLAVEFLKSRRRTLEEGFLPEWGIVALALLAMTLANRLILSAVVVETIGLGSVLLHMLATLLAYPLIVLIAKGWPFAGRAATRRNRAGGGSS